MWPHEKTDPGSMPAQAHYALLRRESRLRRWALAATMGAVVGWVVGVQVGWWLGPLAGVVAVAGLLIGDRRSGIFMAWPSDLGCHALAAAAASLERQGWTVLLTPRIAGQQPGRTAYLLMGPGGVFVVEHQVWPASDHVTTSSTSGLLQVGGRPAARRTASVRAAAAAVDEALSDALSREIPVRPILVIDGPLDRPQVTIGVAIVPIATPGPGRGPLPGAAVHARRRRGGRGGTPPVHHQGGAVTRVLVVDDDPQTLHTLWIALTARGYQVVIAADGATALRVAARARPDAVVLELDLPDVAGVEVIAGLRGWTAVPIIVLSGRTGAEDQVLALDTGADDYVAKPFGMPEFLARLRAVLRRAVATTPGERDDRIVDAGAFTVDLAAKKVWRDGSEVRLTPTEWSLLEILIRHRGNLVTHRQLLEQVWGARPPHRHPLPACLLRPTAPQTGTAAPATAAPDHRAGQGLPVLRRVRRRHPAPRPPILPIGTGSRLMRR